MPEPVRRVLVVSYVFPPMVAGGAPRWAQLCTYLPEFDWLPTVLTAEVQRADAVDTEAIDGLPRSVRVVRARCPLAGAGPRGAVNPGSGLRWAAREGMRWVSRMAFVPDRQVLWEPFAMHIGHQALREVRYDAVVATHGPGTDLVVGRRLAKKHGLPLVVDFRDLWGDLPTADFPTRLHRRHAERLERACAGEARKIVAVSVRMADHLARRYHRLGDDVVSIPNGFDPADALRVNDTREAGQRPFRLCYVGSVYGAYDFSGFFDAMATLVQEGRATASTLRVHFVGNLSSEMPKRYGLSELFEIEPHVPHGRVFDVLNRADAHLVVENPSYWSEFGYPAKVFDYLLTGKPVLGLVEPGGNCGRLITEAGVGVIARPDDRDGIVRALLSLLARKGELPKRIDVEQPPLVAHNRRHLARRLADVLDSASRGNGGPAVNGDRRG